MSRGMTVPRRLSPLITSLLILLIAYLALFLMLAAAISPERYDIRAGEVSSITITATKDVEDTLTTRALADEAARAVQPSYVSDASVQPAVLALLRDGFDRLKELKAQTVSLGDGESAGAVALQQAASALSPAKVDDGALQALLRASADEVDLLSERTYALVRETMTGKLTEGQENEAVMNIRRDLSGGEFDEGLVSVAIALVNNTILPNMLLDEETTSLNREKAREEVAPVVYKTGQNIVRAGEVVTAAQIEMLNSLGMLKDRSVDMTLYAGLSLLLLLLMLLIAFYLNTFAPQLLREPGTVSLLSLILILTTALSLPTRALSSYLMPVALGAMLVALLIKPRLAIVVNVVLSVTSGILASADSSLFTSTTYSVMLVTLVSGSLSVTLIRRRPGRFAVLLTGLWVALFNMAATLAVGLLNSANQANVLSWALWSGGSGLLSAVFLIGVQPALEWLFNLVTPSKLMELSNPNQPLLRRMLLEAPGTYHHSIIVANLAEAAADAVGADGLLARVGAYYHDIGKLKRPLYFKENQLHDNPHDRTDPRVSTAILTAHTRDGAEMGQKERLPEPVLEIIRQHHGDTPVLFFYDRAVKQGGEVDLNDFRYDGPRPRSREAAIVMLADTVEAAARAMAESTPDKLSQMIRRLVRSKMEDGQLDECALTFSDINRISEAFMTVLNGIYHERVEYPTVEIPERPLTPEPEKPAKQAVKPPEKQAEKPVEKPPEPEKSAPGGSEEAGDKPCDA